MKYEEINRRARERYANDEEYRNKKIERARKRYIKIGDKRHHGMNHTPEHESWRSMKARVRCVGNKDYKKYKDYSIDPKWETFLGFYNDMGKRPDGTSLDRIDNSQGYFKENCRWATPAQQAHNTKVTKLSDEKVKEMKSRFSSTPNYILAREYGVSQQTVCGVKKGRTWKEVDHV